jgi:hypothetical protein
MRWLTWVMGAVSAAALSVAASPPPDDLTTDWQFAVGAPAEGLLADAGSMPSTSIAVALPHRALEPDTPLWYMRDINLPADGWLEVNADNGAQGGWSTSDTRTTRMTEHRMDLSVGIGDLVDDEVEAVDGKGEVFDRTAAARTEVSRQVKP